MKSLFLTSIMLAGFGMAISVVREYFYVSQQMNWATAQNYCRENYWDLATITNAVENQRAVIVPGSNDFWAWIGLNRTTPSVNTWQWSDGEKINYTNWHSSTGGSGQNCAVLATDGWHDTDCDGTHSSICDRMYTLVKENKTWEEALQYCRSNYTGLAIVDSETLLDLLQIETKQAQTASVWTGLHFLSGKWVWVNRTLPTSLVSLPSCPVEPYRCGAYNFFTYVWENRDCNEELNFICYE